MLFCSIKIIGKLFYKDLKIVKIVMKAPRF